MYRTNVTPATSTPRPPIQAARAGQEVSRLAQGTIKNNATRPVVYLINALSPTTKVLINQLTFRGWRTAATNGTTPSKSKVTINASLCALPAVSNSISGFQANMTNAASRARGLVAISRP